MTEIFFYSGAADKLQVACRLCAKALRQENRVVVYAPDTGLLERLDKLLWTFHPTSFLPHCYIDDDSEWVETTPIILSNRVAQVHDCDMLINLDEQCPPAIGQFKRVIEITSRSSADKSSARKRYRFYKQAGYDLHHHDLAESIN